MNNQEIQNELLQVQKEISELPIGYISKKTINGKTKQYLQWTENGKKKSKYVDDELAEELRVKIERRRELQKREKDIMDETMELAANSSGDGKRFQQEIKALSEQMVVIREQLEMAKEKIASNEKINSEIENIKEYLSSSDICFTEYSDVTVRRLVEYIRVMKDNSIIIVLKGGIQIREPIETNN